MPDRAVALVETLRVQGSVKHVHPLRDRLRESRRDRWTWLGVKAGNRARANENCSQTARSIRQ